jgi:glutathione peroxidase
MNYRQKFLKFAYPIFNKINLLFGKSNRILKSTSMAPDSFYNLKATLNNGSSISFDQFKNKKVLLVNTASECGFTHQYEGLQQLHEKFKDKLQVIGFPSNEFGEQEKANDEGIEQFCKVNYGVSFPLAQKSLVKKSDDQNEVYQWLTDEEKNGWNYVAPTWNFCKYLIDENGNLTHFFEAAIEPMSDEMLEAIGGKVEG